MSDTEWWIPDKPTLTCPGCGRLMAKHIVKEGARYHVLWWDSIGTHCSEKDCEYNHYACRANPTPE